MAGGAFFSRTGIRVNALAPGFLLTSQNFNLMIDQASGHTTERAARILTQTPMQRFGEPKELIGPLLWLASAAASGYVNGAVIPVDGASRPTPACEEEGDGLTMTC